MVDEKKKPLVTTCGVCKLDFEVPNVGWRFYGEVGYVCPSCPYSSVITKKGVEVVII